MFHNITINMPTFVKALILKFISYVISHNATSLFGDIIVPFYRLLRQKQNTKKEEVKKIVRKEHIIGY